MRSKRRAGAALRALLELGAKDVAVLEDGVERRIPVDQLSVGTTFVVRPGEKSGHAGKLEGRQRAGVASDPPRLVDRQPQWWSCASSCPRTAPPGYSAVWTLT